MNQAAWVVAVQDDLVTLEAEDGVLRKNEVVYVLPQRGKTERLKAEILRVRGRLAEAQVFEGTSGVAVGDLVERTGELLSVQLGPGLLGKVYDGLQRPLADLAASFGFFLPRGVELDPLDRKRRWAFVPKARKGTRLRAGEVLGTVQEGAFVHKIMVPFDLEGEAELAWIREAQVSVEEPIAALAAERGELKVTLAHSWPVRRPLPEKLIAQGIAQREYPTQPLVTSIRLIDTLFPIALGGTCCIPGPFGAGKTVLQHLIARYSAVDIVVMVACGERAGEVVEILSEFPKLADPKTGAPLMERTIVIVNTSAMPVAARESSLYTGVTIAEYYRQMGLNVLLLADSTSRWAQAMREISGRMEEIPGEEAFPAYLASAIRSLYERAGVISGPCGTSSLTFIGTVSPAGGNFEEPVTQATLATVKVFLGLSAERAYKRAYPAIDPLLSWSRYLDQLRPWFERELPGWTAKVEKALALLRQGEAVYQMMQVTGEEGVALEDFVIYQKAWLLDVAYLQQNAYDAVDVSTPLARQKKVFSLMMQVLERPYTFADKEAARRFFLRLAELFRNLNYAPSDSEAFQEYWTAIQNTLEVDGRNAA
jgi:V/A-type H+-transporting ATPase subunit A